VESEDLAPVRTDKEAKGGICIRPDENVNEYHVEIVMG
jgi:hypothetical protein